jgi:hypothetical protein
MNFCEPYGNIREKRERFGRGMREEGIIKIYSLTLLN